MRRPITLSYILAARWFMHQRSAESYFPTVMNLMEGKRLLADDEYKEKPVSKTLNSKGVYYISDLGISASPEDAPENSVAVIQINGPIMKYDYCGDAGTLTKLDLHNRAMANPNIIGAVYEMDSGGGDADAVEYLTNEIRKSTKPVVMYVRGMAASAAYWIASSGTEIVMDGATSQVGSIGAFVQFINFTEYYKSLGIDVRRIYAPQSKLKNKAYEDLFKGDDAEMKGDLKVLTDFFIDSVKQHRGDKVANAHESVFQGEMFYTQDAIKHGLADAEGNMEYAVSRVRELANNNNTQNSHSNNYNMKLSIKAAWTSLLSFFKLSVPSGQDSVDHEVSAEEGQRLNDKLQEVYTLQNKVDTLQENVVTLTQERDEWKTKAEEYGKQPGEKPTAEANAGDPNPEDKNWDSKKVAGFGHNKFMKQALGE